ncbi:hypothetical protein ACN47E_000734 [Coniothyrium glycines]
MSSASITHNVTPTVSYMFRMKRKRQDEPTPPTRAWAAGNVKDPTPALKRRLLERNERSLTYLATTCRHAYIIRKQDTKATLDGGLSSRVLVTKKDLSKMLRALALANEADYVEDLHRIVPAFVRDDTDSKPLDAVRTTEDFIDDHKSIRTLLLEVNGLMSKANQVDERFLHSLRCAVCDLHRLFARCHVWGDILPYAGLPLRGLRDLRRRIQYLGGFRPLTDLKSRIDSIERGLTIPRIRLRFSDEIKQIARTALHEESQKREEEIIAAVQAEMAQEVRRSEEVDRAKDAAAEKQRELQEEERRKARELHEEQARRDEAEVKAKQRKREDMEAERRREAEESKAKALRDVEEKRKEVYLKQQLCEKKAQEAQAVHKAIDQRTVHENSHEALLAACTFRRDFLQRFLDRAAHKSIPHGLPSKEQCIARLAELVRTQHITANENLPYKLAQDDVLLLVFERDMLDALVAVLALQELGLELKDVAQHLWSLQDLQCLQERLQPWADVLPIADTKLLLCVDMMADVKARAERNAVAPPSVFGSSTATQRTHDSGLGSSVTSNASIGPAQTESSASLIARADGAWRVPQTHNPFLSSLPTQHAQHPAQHTPTGPRNDVSLTPPPGFRSSKPCRPELCRRQRGHACPFRHQDDSALPTSPSVPARSAAFPAQVFARIRCDPARCRGARCHFNHEHLMKGGGEVMRDVG